ncbi:MAG: feruloyl-CoA synthase [Betaproteobacteria bacterium]|nr:MAG: feruloyl-CoA synthase [Betaproteobacteria bacterium]
MGTGLQSSLRFAPPRVEIERRRDGTILLRSPLKLGKHARAVGEWLVRWARETPERTFLAERTEGAWRRLSYREALVLARRVAQGLLDRRLDASRPLVILSDNSIDHALLALGAMHVGVPVAPVSPAYSLMSKDFAKLKAIFELLRPGLVWTADPEKFAPALAAVRASTTPITELLAEATSKVDAAFERIGPDTVAKILFTSGSTGIPKGVINTQRMLTVNQEQYASVWPFLEDRPQVLVDWLPWNHTFGGNNNFGMMLRNGGTFHIDGGKPAPGLVETSMRNLKEIPPTIYFNVPRGFDLLMPFLEKDAELRANFFRNLDLMVYAGASLPQNLWERMQQLAVAERGARLPLISAWGSTETAPMATGVHYAVDRAGIIGLPVPGCEVKLVPAAGKLEARVKGPNVTPGYYGRDDLTKAAFDEEGYYRIGDALKFADPEKPELGLAFDGRIAEDFKLSTGTWVHVGATRVRLIAAGDPLVQDAVITGHERSEVGALVFLNAAAIKVRGLDDAGVRRHLRAALAKLAAEAGSGSSTHPVRALVMAEPLSIDANEITDKGYINQRAVLERRAASVEMLHADPPASEVIVATP